MYSIAMAQIAHPTTGESIDVEVIDEQSYSGTDVVQVQATDEDTVLSDQSGDAPWMEADEVEA